MSIRRTVKARRGAAAALMAVTLALAATACGGGDEDKTSSGSSSQPSPENKEGGDKPDTGPDTNQKIAEVEGRDGMVLTLYSAKRDSGGFVTVNGQVKNTGDKAYYATTEWRGTETELQGGGQSVGGATLIDKADKKRYYVLRDTEGRCLCTSGFTQVDAGKEMAIFMQFPAPPEDSNEVDFQLPSFPSVTIQITQ
ncbi:hypothetical protein GCM10010420_20740 [Streptomyces glaucosporus]|uniref:Secreted protein n=1 Tax=Streptomyces glaucosporus TaxID=284044 RepID=A0ABN3I5K9_9ACTN